MSNAPPLFNKGLSTADTSQAVYSGQGRSRNTLSTSQSHSPQKNNVSGSRNARYTAEVASGPFSPSLDIISLNSHTLSDDDNHILNSSFFEFQTDNDSSELSSELSSQDPQHIVPQPSNDAQQRFDSQLNMVRSRREQLQSSWDQDWIVFEPSENDDNYSLGDDLDDSSDNDNSYISEHERVIGLHLSKTNPDHGQDSGRFIPKSSCSSTPGTPRGATTPLAFPSHNGSGSFLDTLNKSVAVAAAEIEGQYRRSLTTSKDSDSLKPSLSSNNATRSQDENLLVNFQSNNLRNYHFENHSSAKNKSSKSSDKEISTRYQKHATSTQVDGSLAITHGLQPVTAPQSDVFGHKNKQTHNATNDVKDSPSDDVLIPHIDNHRPLNHTFKKSSTGSPMNSVERVNAWRLNQSQHVLTELRKFERKRARKLSNSNSSFSSSANKVIDSLANLENIELARFKKSVSSSNLAQKYPTTPSTYSELAGSDLFSIDSAQNDTKKTSKQKCKLLKKAFGSLSDLSRLDINSTKKSDGLGHEANSTTTPYKYDHNTANLAAAGERSESVPSSFKSEILASWGLPEEEQDEDFFLHNSASAYYHQNRDIPNQDTSSKYDKPDLFQSSVLSHNTENKDPAAVLADELYFILSSSTPNETAAQLLQLRNFTNHTLDLENVGNEQDGMIQGLGNLTQELGRLLGAAAENNKDMSRKVSKTKRHHRPNDNVDKCMQEAGQNESFWQYITRKVLYNFIGLDDELLEVIVGDRFIDPDKQVNEGVLNGKHGLSTTNNAVGKLQKPSSILTSGNATPTKYNDYGNYLPRYNPSSETAFNENRTGGSALHGLISADKSESKEKCGEKEESESDDDDMTDIPDDRSEVYLDINQRLDDIALATLNAINEGFQKGNRSKSGTVVSWNQQLTTKISNELYAASAAIKKKYVFGSNKGKIINSSHRQSANTSQLDNNVSASAYQSFKSYSDAVENESVRLKKEEEPQSATALIVLEYLRVRLLVPFYSADILNGEQLIDTSTEESSVEDDDDKTESKSPSDTGSKKSRSESGNNSSHQSNDDIKSDTQEHDALSESFGKKNSQKHAQVGPGASNSHNLNTSLGAIAHKIFFRKEKENVSVSETSSSHILSSVTNAEDGENSMTSSLLLKQTSSVVSGLVSSVLSQQQQSACKLESRQQSLPDGEVGEEESASNYWEMGSFSTGSGSDIANLVGAW